MKNWEKYEEELKKFGIENFAVSNGSVCRCVSIDCADCDFSSSCYNDVKIRWLYKEANRPKVTKKARKFLEIVEFGYIARDKDGVMCWYKNKPYRCDTYWETPISNDDVFLELKNINMEKEFSFITWDRDFWSVEELLKLEVEE